MSTSVVDRFDKALGLLSGIRSQLDACLKQVHKLNINHNPDWVFAEYKKWCIKKRRYLLSTRVKKLSPRPLKFLHVRTSSEILASYTRVNTNFIKLKRSFESIWHQYQRTWNVSTQFDNVYKSTHICNHSRIK